MTVRPELPADCPVCRGPIPLPDVARALRGGSVRSIDSGERCRRRASRGMAKGRRAAALLRAWGTVARVRAETTRAEQFNQAAVEIAAWAGGRANG